MREVVGRTVALLALLLIAGCGGGGGASSAAPPGDAVDARAGAAGVPVRISLDSPRTVLLDPAAGESFLLVLVSHAPPPGETEVVLDGGTNLVPKLGRGRADSGLARDAATSGFVSGRQTLGEPRSFGLGGVGFAVSVATTLREIGTHGLFYVDDDTPRADFSDADLADLAAVFDQQLYPLDVQLFGSPYDYDQNGRVVLLFTPYLNQRGYGAFTGADLQASSGNGADMLYLLVPRPGEGQGYATLRSALLATLIHELQHLINYSRKRFEQGLPGADESWLNEALSFLAEQSAGLLDTAGGSPENVAFYYRSPESYTLRQLTGSYDDGHAGAGYLFVRYLVDRFGAGVLRQLVGSGLRGPDNVALATGVPFATLLDDWAAAMALDDRDLAVEARYQIPGFDSRGDYANGVSLQGLGETIVTGGALAGRFPLARTGVRILRLTGLSEARTITLSAPAAGGVTAQVIRLPAG